MKQIFCFFMTMLLLFADAGQTIYAHTCLKSNHVSYSINTPAACKEEQQEHAKKSCCEKEKQQQESEDCTVGKKDCCTVSGKYIKASLGADVIKDIQVSMPIQAAAIAIFLLFSFEVDALLYTVHNSPPPLLAYSNSQSFIQNFRI